MRSKIIFYLSLLIPVLLCCSSTVNNIANSNTSLENIKALSTLSSSSLDYEINTLMDSLLDSMLTETKIYKVAMFDIFNSDGTPTELEYYLSNEIRDILNSKTASKMKLMDAEIVRRNIVDYQLEPTKENIAKNMQIWQDMGTMIVLIGSWRNYDSENIYLTIDAYDVKQNVPKIASMTKPIHKNSRVRALIGDKIPGAMVVHSDDLKARVYCDDDYFGPIVGSWKMIEVPYGTHHLKVERAGYKPFVKDIQVDERGIGAFEVKFVTPSLAPVTSFTCNAILPMSSAWIYGRRMGMGKTSSVMNILCSSLFYSSVLVKIIDYNKPYYISGQYHHFYKNFETYMIAGTYSLNLLTGYWVGKDYLNQNKRGIQIAHAPKEGFNILFGWDANIKLVGLTYAF